jgi:CDGSH-type Zn-finger protein
MRRSKDLTQRDGRLVVEPIPDRALVVDGPVEIVAGTGHTTARTSEAVLCRSGQSQDKPFWDGSMAGRDFELNDA